MGQRCFVSLEGSGLTQIMSTLLTSVPVEHREYSLDCAILQTLLEHCLGEYKYTWEKKSVDLA